MKKPRRYENEAYKDFIRSKPCCVTGLIGVDPHHTKSRGAGGSDLTCVPLANVLHVECHAIGQDTFQKKYNIDFKEIRLKLLEEWVESHD